MSKSLAERVKDEPAAAGEPSDRARASGREQRGERQQGKKAAKAARVALAVEKQAAAAADEQAATAASKELPPSGAFADLVLSLIATPNPQQHVNNKPGEKQILDKICRWLKARNIPYTSDLSWGVHAVLTSAWDLPVRAVPVTVYTVTSIPVYRYTQDLEVPFSAVSKPNFATKGYFCSIFQSLQDSYALHLSKLRICSLAHHFAPFPKSVKF